VTIVKSNDYQKVSYPRKFSITGDIPRKTNPLFTD